jgi:hypothetical protein
LTPHAAAERRPRTASEIALHLAESRLSEAQATRAALEQRQRLQRLRASLKAKLGDIEPNADAPSRVLWTKQFPNFVIQAVALDTAPEVSVPLLLIKPNASASKRLATVLAFAQEGKAAFLSRRGAELATLVNRGVAICLADVRGTGETEPEGGSDSVASLVATEFMLGSTGIGVQLKDARTVLRYLSRRGDLDPKRLALWGDSFAQVNPPGLLLDQSVRQAPGPQVIYESDPLGSVLALLTALYEDNVRAVAARGGLVSWLSALRDRFCYVPEDVIIPGILETTDVADVVATLAPRAVLLEGLVDGRDRLLSASRMENELANAFAAYRSVPSCLVVRERLPEPELSMWMAKQLSQ